MNINVLLPIMSITLPLLGAGVGYMFKHYIEKKKELLSDVNIERRELYQQFVNLVIDLLSTLKTGKYSSEKQIMSKLYEFYKKYILYASPEVINAFSDYFQYLYKINSNSETMDYKFHFKKLSKVMIEMRKDLGLSNKKLGKDGERLFRAMLTDFDKVIN